MMAERKITIQLKGSISDDEHVRLADFIEELSAIREILSEIDRKIIKSSEPSADYRIVNLSHSSPARVVIEAIPVDLSRDTSVAIIDKFFIGLSAIQGGKVPEEFDSVLLERFKKLGKGFHGNISEIIISRGNSAIGIGRNFEAEIIKIIGEDELSSGSMTGMLEMINIHRGHRFDIYPTAGPEKIRCNFKKDLLREAVEGIGRYVSVAGRLKYKSRDRYAYAMDVSEIEIYPEEEKLPSILELRGIAPDATGELSSAEFIRQLRENAEE